MQVFDDKQDLQSQQYSPRLEEAIDNIVISFQKIPEAVARCIEIAKEENADLKAVGKSIRRKLLQAGFHRNSVTNFFPPECKALPRGSTQAISTKFVQNSAVERFRLDLEELDFANLQRGDLEHFTKSQLIEIILEHSAAIAKSRPRPKIKSLELSHKSDHKQQRLQSHNSINKSNGKPYRGNHQWISDEKIEQILRLRREGKTGKDISKIVGISTNSVLKRIRMSKAEQTTTLTNELTV